MRDLPLRLHGLARWLLLRGHHRPARVVTWVSSLVFSCVLAPEADIGATTRLHHHALGIVIHPCTTVGEHCHILHHVTLATDVPLDSGKRMVVGNGVSIGTNAVLLGPLTIGDGATIGAGSIVTRDVPAGATVVGNPAKIIARDAT